MARPLRLEHPGAIWHIRSRSDERKGLFRDDADREGFLETVARAVSMFRWKIHGWALLPSEFHLIVETPEPNLSRGMREINGIYTQRYNRRYNRSGALMRGRFRGVLVEREMLLNVLRHVLLLPVAAGLASSPSQYAWSSFRMTAGLKKAPAWLSTDWVLAQFGKNTEKAQKAFRAFVGEKEATAFNPAEHIVRQLYLGSSDFRKQAEKAARARSRGAKRPPMKAILVAVAEEFGTTEEAVKTHRRGEARKAAAFLARREGNLRLADIARPLGIADLSASQLARAGETLASSDRAFAARLDRISRKLRAE